MKDIKKLLYIYLNNDKQFQFWCSGPTDGISMIDNIVTKREDYRTRENYKIAKDCGFNCIHFGNNILSHQLEMGKPGVITQEEFKKKNDNALAAMNEVGFRFAVISDYRYTNFLSRKHGGLIGNDKDFKDERELDNYIRNCSSWYKDYPGVNGFDVGDEPTWWGLESFGQVYKSIGRLFPNKYRYYNFFGFAITEETENSYGNFKVLEGETYYEAAKKQYIKYLDKAVKCMGTMDYMRFDIYPIGPNKISEYYIPSLDIIASYTRDNNMELGLYLPSFEMLHYGTLRYSRLSEQENRLCHNTALAFGAKSFEYFTYTTGRESMTRGETFIDGGSPITLDNKKTYLYYDTKRIIEEIVKIEKIILCFNYNGYGVYISDIHEGRIDHLYRTKNDYAFRNIKKYLCDRECLLVTELYDKEHNNYLYSLINISDTKIDKTITTQTISIIFNDDVTEVIELYRGNSKFVELVNHEYKKELVVGDAIFLLISK